MPELAVRKVIPLSEPEFSGNEWKYVKDCLDNGWVSSAGSYVNRFEEIVKDYVGCRFAVATTNGTSSLHLSLLACGIQPDDEVIVPTLTFIATVNVIKYCCANPIFMDCDPKTLCMDVQKVADFISNECKKGGDGLLYNKMSGKKIKAIIPVHVFGHPVDMDILIKISKEYGITIIEDATESLGSEYKGQKSGSFGEIGCLSFNGNKIITTGGGGMILTNNKGVADKIRHLSTQAKKDPFEYDHDEIGYNYRLTNIQAALGIAQMERLDEFITIKRKNAHLYKELLLDVEGLEFLKEKPWARSNYWFYTIRIPKKHKKSLMEFLLSRKIQVRPIWKLIHTLPMYNGAQSFSIEKAVEAYESCVNLPCSVNLKEDVIKFVVENIKDYFDRYI